MTKRNFVLAGVAIAVLADTALWLVGTWILSIETARWAKRMQGQGWVVSSEHQTWGGWPFTASLTMDKTAISGGARYIPGGLAWSADRVVASVIVFRPFTVRVAAEGQQFLRLAQAPDLGFMAGLAIAELPLGSGRHGRGTLKLTDVSGGIAGSGHPQDVQIAGLSVTVDAKAEAEDRPHVAAVLDVEASGVGLPDIGRWPLGAMIAGAGATISVTSPLLKPTDFDADSRGASQAAAWRDGGGTVMVQDAKLRWGPLRIDADARLALDDRLQPSGSGRADASGTAPALDAAAQAGLIAPGLALTAKAVLAVMAHVPGPDGNAVRLPFLLHDRTVSVGQIPVARLPEIRW